jgi:cadmium resistance protein CadD (predicted permease)
MWYWFPKYDQEKLLFKTVKFENTSFIPKLRLLSLFFLRLIDFSRCRNIHKTLGAIFLGFCLLVVLSLIYFVLAYVIAEKFLRM